MELDKAINEAVKELVKKYCGKIVAVGIFGSYARREFTEKSDIDILVIVENWERSLERRFKIYDILFKHIKRDITLIDIDLEDAEALLKGKLKLSSTMLNILYDCIVLYDPKGILRKLIEETKMLVERLKLRRYKIGRSYGWVIQSEARSLR